MVYAIIVAAGSGIRMQNSIPKQFLELAGKPILYYAIEKMQFVFPDIKIIVVLSAAHEAYAEKLKEYFNNTIQIASGGSSRFESVKNGLALLPNDGIVLIHDAVRPFVSDRLLHRCYENAFQFGNAIPCIDVQDSIRRIDDDGESEIIPRSELKAIQTPQTFNLAKLQMAYQQAFDEGFTDDASVYEAHGNIIHLVEGEVANFKITTPLDLMVAEKLVESRK